MIANNVCCESTDTGITEQQQQQQIQEQQEKNVMLPESIPLSLPPPPPPPPPPPQDYDYAERAMNMTLFDPPRWGWTAVGGVADLLSPHERSRRRSTCVAYKKKGQRIRRNGRSKIQTLATIRGVENLRGDNSAESTNLTTHGSDQQQNQLDTNSTTEIIAQLKDPPAYSIEPSTTSLSSPSTRQSLSLENQPTSESEPTSSQLLSKDLQQPQNLTMTESKTTATATAVSILATDASNNDSANLQHKKIEITKKKDGLCNQNNNIDGQFTKPSIMIDSEGIGGAISLSIPPAQPPRQPEADIGVQVMGIPTNILGMKIERSEKSNQENRNDQRDGCSTKNIDNNTSNRKNNKNSRSFRRSGGIMPRYDCRIQSLGYDSNNNNDAVIDSDILGEEIDGRRNGRILDMYAYHLGREGMEARDAETGELLITHQVTDTNNDLDAPKSIVSIGIEFPLEDDDDEEENSDDNNSYKNDYFNDDGRIVQSEALYGEGGDSKEGETSSLRSSQKAIYREAVTWDLSDKNTPTPLAFATSIGREYGLSFGQTMDLAVSIDQQIEAHIIATIQFREPITVENPQEQQSERRHAGPIIQAYRYDQAIEIGQCGISKLSKDREAAKYRSATGSVQIRNNGSLSSDTGGTNSGIGRRRDNFESTVTTIEEDDISKELIDEVKRRSRAESVLDVSRNCQNGIIGVLESKENGICHICKKRQGMCYMFACSQTKENHSYCQQHMNSRLGVRGESGVFAFHYCPICCLKCECAKCQRKLHDVAKIFKAKSIDQEKELAEVYFPDILSTCANKIIPTELDDAIDIILEQKRQKNVHRQITEQQNKDTFQESYQKSPTFIKPTQTVQFAEQTMVPRPPLTDFIGEVCSNGKELEAGTIDLYFTVFSAEGQRQVSDLPDAWLQDERVMKSGSSLPTKDVELEEDENNDFCHVCTTAGDLIYCDFCPRAFHEGCIENYEQPKSPDDQCLCDVCRKEKTESDYYFLDGKESLDAINAAFLNLNPTDERVFIGLEVLSIIHQMLQNLMDYDEFGIIFSAPVDTSEFPGYKDVVKRPMDIGTISSRLINGNYTKLLDGNFSMDDLVTKILNDIELVWCNCIKFNVIGSIVSRMAAVLRRRVIMIRKRSIDQKLSDRVKNDIHLYSQEFENAWINRVGGKPSEEYGNMLMPYKTWKDNTVKKKKPRSKSNIIIKASSHGKPIAILDTVSGRVIKTYSTVKSASQAAQILLNLGHRCEWNGGKSGLNLKLIVLKSASDPSSLLFGYRWLFLEDLNDGKVTFLDHACDIIEMQHNQCTFVFRTIEEAISSSDLSKTLNIDELRKKLIDLPRNGDWTGIDGMKWRRPILPSKESSLKKASTISIESQSAFVTRHATHSGILPSWRKCTILKKDLVADRNLVGFEDISFAYQNWLQTIVGSPAFLESEAQTLESFKKYYLDGDRNVDGIIWETVDCSNLLEEKEGKQFTKIDNTKYAIENQDQTTQNVGPDGNEGNVSTRTEESRNVSSMNESSFVMIDDHRITSKPSVDLPVDESVSRKRKCLDDKEMVDLQVGKEARFPVTV